MRKIKFRAFIDGEMISADDLAFDEYAPLTDQLANCENVMQFTEQSVKKDAELYEGDVLSFDWLYQDNDKPYAEDSMGILGIIEWRGRFVVSFFGGAMSFDLHEINQVTFERFWRQDYHSAMTEYFKMVNFRLAGNIHENPELLCAKK